MHLTLFLLLGLCFGSFGSVIVTRVPGGRRICGRSGCPQCEKQLSPLELVPVFSYLVLRGRCRGCTQPIGLLYPFIEVLSGVLFGVAWWVHGLVLPSLLLALCLWLLLLIMIIDLQTQTISDLLNIPFVICAIAYALVSDHFVVSGMVVGVAFFGVQWLLSRGRWIGSGDVILAAGIGAFLGHWKYVAACLLLTYIVGGFIAGVLLLLKKVRRGQHIAFGPLLGIGAFLTLLLRARIDLFASVYFGI